MVIETVCVRCRKSYGGMMVEGGLPFMVDQLVSDLGGRTCNTCGGDTRAVRDDQVLPFEFVATPRRVLAASLASMCAVSVVWVLPIVGLAISGTGPIVRVWFLPMLAVAAGVGLLIPLLEAPFAASIHNINDPHRKGQPPPAEGTVMSAFLIPVVAASAAAFYWLIPIFGATSAEVRSPLIRAIVGCVAGLLAVSSATMQLFKRGRRPPAANKRWRFGDKPE